MEREKVLKIFTELQKSIQKAMIALEEPRPERIIASAPGHETAPGYEFTPALKSLVTGDYKAIKEINEPTELMKIVAVRKDPKAIQFIKDPSENLQLLAVKKEPNLIDLIETPTEAVLLEAISQESDIFLKYIDNLNEGTDELKKAVLKIAPDYIQEIPKPTEEMKLIAVSTYGEVISMIVHPSEAVQLEAIRENVDQTIFHIEYPTEKVLIEAVHTMKNPYLLERHYELSELVEKHMIEVGIIKIV